MLVITAVPKAVAVFIMPSIVIPVVISIPVVITATIVVRTVVAFNATGENQGGAEKNQEPKISSHMCSRIRFSAT